MRNVTSLLTALFLNAHWWKDSGSVTTKQILSIASLKHRNGAESLNTLCPTTSSTQLISSFEACIAMFKVQKQNASNKMY